MSRSNTYVTTQREFRAPGPSLDSFVKRREQLEKLFGTEGARGIVSVT